MCWCAVKKLSLTHSLTPRYAFKIYEGAYEIQGRYRKGPLSQKSAHAEQYAQTKSNTNPSPDPNRYRRRRCPDPNFRIQKFKYITWQ